MSRNFRIFEIFLKNRRITRKHSDTSRTIDRKDRKSGKKRAIRERRPSPRSKQKKRASVRFLVSSLLEDATVCPTVCTTCSTRCDWATRANLPSFAYDCRRWQRAYHLFQTVFTTGLSGLNKRMVNDRESFRENEFCPVISLVL